MLIVVLITLVVIAIIILAALVISNPMGLDLNNQLGKNLRQSYMANKHPPKTKN